jgi:hypothetical protein
MVHISYYVNKHHETIIYCLLMVIVLLSFFLYSNFTKAEVYVCYYGETEPWITDNTMFSYMYKEKNVYKDNFLGFSMICNSTLYNRVDYVGSYTLQKSHIESMLG